MACLKDSRALITVALFAIIVLAVAGCSSEAGSVEDVRKMTLGVERGILPSPVWIAESEGYFREEGLDVTIKNFDSGRLSFLAMLEGEDVDVSTVAPTPIVSSSFERRDFSILATFAYSFDDIKIIARADAGIATATDMVGKRIGTPKGTTGEYVVDAFLVLNGIPPSDVQVVDIEIKYTIRKD